MQSETYIYSEDNCHENIRIHFYIYEAFRNFLHSYIHYLYQEAITLDSKLNYHMLYKR